MDDYLTAACQPDAPLPSTFSMIMAKLTLMEVRHEASCSSDRVRAVSCSALQLCRLRQYIHCTAHLQSGSDSTAGMWLSGSFWLDLRHDGAGASPQSIACIVLRECALAAIPAMRGSTLQLLLAVPATDTYKWSVPAIGTTTTPHQRQHDMDVSSVTRALSSRVVYVRKCSHCAYTTCVAGPSIEHSSL
jgi:hypothetical protein